MSARPYQTFQSEGWYRPGRARKNHYFRMIDEDSMRLVSLCENYLSGGGIRPHLKYSSEAAQQCVACWAVLRPVLMAPQGTPWFEIAVTS